MNTSVSTSETTSTPAASVKVWDPLVRLFHWSLVAAFAVAWFTGDEESRIHELAGYAVIGLVLVRILWGFIGTRYARFSDFVHRPSTVLGYAKDTLIGKPRRYLGHNPLGGMMIIALLISLLATGATGFALHEAEEGFALTMPTPIARALADDDAGEDEENESNEELLEELHEFFANLTLLLVMLHVAGVIVSSLAHRENLVSAMLTGRKRV